MKTIRGKTPLRNLFREHSRLNPPRRELAFLLQDWDDGYNVGGLFRTAEALGAVEVVMSGHTPTPPDPLIERTSMGQHRRVPWRHFAGHEEAALALLASGWTLVAVEIAEDAVSYRDFAFPPRTALVLGNEANGVYGNVLKHCAGAVFIPMYGKGRSLNVQVAAAVVGYHALLSD
ncbi:MAG: TrmH family RNA methyltransferase [Fimbriimonadaceae bacterium]|nr:TrmH family RNA methyltransferase [Fimbriimonadaceae bacterium]QYK56085.1 MAG: TrmH family RNA methyltransferase [Fimbriimonadaceae bacterium]